MRLPLLCAALTALAVSAPALAQSDFYAGKRITIIVGSESGGGYDTHARVMSRHFGKFLTGNPAVIVQNMPGAGSIVATNYLSNVAPKDGTSLGIIQRTMLTAKLARLDGVQFDPLQINWVGNLTTEVGMVVSWHSHPVKTAQDLFTKELIVGGAGVAADTEATPRLLNAVLGTKFKVVSGYRGNTNIMLALENGEIGGLGDWAWPNIKTRRPDFLRDRKINLIMQLGFEKLEDAPSDIPLVMDFAKTEDDRKVLQLYFAQKQVARPVMAPPGVSPERMKELRTAFDAMVKDQEAIADAIRAGVEISATSSEDVGKVMALIAATPPHIAERLAEAIKPR
jgi:tripartite-type tricarboxylate transporter receptor subunit TctC